MVMVIVDVTLVRIKDIIVRAEIHAIGAVLVMIHAIGAEIHAIGAIHANLFTVLLDQQAPKAFRVIQDRPELKEFQVLDLLGQLELRAYRDQQEIWEDQQALKEFKEFKEILEIRDHRGSQVLDLLDQLEVKGFKVM